MNILFVSNDPSIFDPMSAARMRMRAYAEEVGKTGGTLHILSQAPKAGVQNDGLLVLHGVRIPKLFIRSRMPVKAHDLIIAHGIDVVSAQDPFEYGWIAMKAIEGTRAKLHVQIHTDFLSPWFVRGAIFRSPQVPMPALNRLRRQMADQVLPKADGVRVVSKRIKDSLTARYGTRMETATIIPIAVPDTIPAPVPLPSNPYTFALISVGRLEPEKRIEDILAALATLKDTYPRLGLVIVGDGRERKSLERQVKKLGLTARVQFLGNRTDALGLMQSAQAFIQASAYEGYGRTLVEAALARVPIITTDVGIVGEVFRGYETILAAPPGDPAQLAFNIRWLIEDQAARKELVVNAEAAARAHLAAQHTTPADIIADIARVVPMPAPVMPAPAAPLA